VHILALLKRGRLLRLGADLVRTKRVQGRVPRIGIRTLLRERRSRRTIVDPILPVWVNDRFAERLQLRDRVRQKSESNEAAVTHPLRPRVSRVLNSHHWSILFEGRDPGLTGVPLEVRHPLADLRLIDYLLSIPLIPWCERKTIVRRAFKGVLPDPIIERPKAPLSADPTLVLLGRTDAAWIDSFEQVPELSEYVDRVRVPRVTGDAASSDGIQHLRPFTLNRWMRYRRRKINKGADDGERNTVA